MHATDLNAALNAANALLRWVMRHTANRWLQIIQPKAQMLDPLFIRQPKRLGEIAKLLRGANSLSV
jgi:hypothetical protein